MATAKPLSPDGQARDAAARNHQGEVAFAAGDLERAEDLHRQALDSYGQLGMGGGVAASLFRLAEVAEARASRHGDDPLQTPAQDAEAPDR